MPLIQLEALGDVELTDYVFSSLRKDPNVDQNIVIVNIGNLSRRQIAEQIQIISKYKPKVIGIDGFFDCSKRLRDTVNCPQLRDTFGNLMLSNAIQEAGNVILVTKVLQADTLLPADVYDSLRRSDSLFIAPAIREGYANLETDAAFQDDVKTCRLFNPKIDIKGKPTMLLRLKWQWNTIRSKLKNFWSGITILKSSTIEAMYSTFTGPRIIRRCFTHLISKTWLRKILSQK